MKKRGIRRRPGGATDESICTPDELRRQLNRPAIHAAAAKDLGRCLLIELSALGG